MIPQDLVEKMNELAEQNLMTYGTPESAFRSGFKACYKLLNERINKLVRDRLLEIREKLDLPPHDMTMKLIDSRLSEVDALTETEKLTERISSLETALKDVRNTVADEGYTHNAKQIYQYVIMSCDEALGSKGDDGE